MPFPPTLPPASRDNATVQQDQHPSDHNLTAAALATIVGALDTRFLLTRDGLGDLNIGDATEVPIVPGVTVFRTGFTVSGNELVYGGSVPIVAQVSAGLRWFTNGNGFRRISIKQNGAEVVEQHVPAHPGGFTSQCCATVVALDPGDTLQLFAWHSAGAVLALTGSARVFFAATGIAEQ